MIYRTVYIYKYLRENTPSEVYGLFCSGEVKWRKARLLADYLGAESYILL
jgi:hypothetical protein